MFCFRASAGGGGGGGACHLTLYMPRGWCNSSTMCRAACPRHHSVAFGCAHGLFAVALNEGGCLGGECSMGCPLSEHLQYFAFEDVLGVATCVEPLGMGWLHACWPAVLVQAQRTRGGPRHPRASVCRDGKVETSKFYLIVFFLWTSNHDGAVVYGSQCTVLL